MRKAISPSWRLAGWIGPWYARRGSSMHPERAVTQLLETLASAGLVESDLNPHDGRSRILNLTERARADIAEFEQQVVTDLTPRFDTLTDNELATLADLLNHLEIP